MRQPLLFAALLVASCSKAPEDGAEAQRALLAANAAYDRALVAGDAAALGRTFTEDFRLIDDDGDIHDKNAQIQFMTRTIDLLSAKSDDIKVHVLGDDAALVTGRFTGKYRARGQDVDFIERYTSVWVRDGDQWRLKHEHSSLTPHVRVAPPPVPPAG